MKFQKLFKYSLIVFGVAVVGSFTSSLSIENDYGFGFPKKVFAQYADKTEKEMEEFSFIIPSGGATEVILDGISKDVRIEKTSGEDVVIVQKGMKKTSAYNLNGEVLKIDLMALGKSSGKDIFFIDMRGENLAISMIDADVIVKLPATVKRLKFASKSGDLKLRGVALDELNVKVLSGDVNVKTTSLNSAFISTISGDIETRLDSGLSNLDAKTVSGDVRIKVRDKEKITLSQKTVSGDYEIRGGTKKRIVKDGAQKNWKIETTSGDIRL